MICDAKISGDAETVAPVVDAENAVLFGKGVGDTATVNGNEWEITAIEAGS